jgi:hypothetical protein
MYQGSAAYNDRVVYTIYPPGPGFLSYHLSNGGQPYLFLDLLGLDRMTMPTWLNGTITARSWGTNEVDMIPIQQYDGLLYIKDVNPPDYVY